MSPITYYNMCLGITEFIDYARYILTTHMEEKFVPNFHSNISNIESRFSLMCHLKADSAATYQSTFNKVDNERSMEVMKGNRMYKSNPEKHFY